MRSLWRRFFGPSFVDYSPDSSPDYSETISATPVATTTDTDAAQATQEEAPFDWQRLGPHVQPDREPIEDTAELCELADRIIEKHCDGVDKLPAFPVLAQRILSSARQGHTDTAELVKLINMDPAVGAQVLKYANSGFYMRDKKADTVHTALIRIGREQVAAIATAAASRTVFVFDERAAKALAPLWRRQWDHAMTTAMTSQWLYGTRDKEGAQKAFMAGMFHDIGKVAALKALCDLPREATDDAAKEPLWARAIHRVHSMLGVDLVTRWNLPAHVVAVCESHHVVPQPDADRIARIVSLVSALNELRTEPTYDSLLFEQVASHQGALGLSRAGLITVVEHLEIFGAQAEAM